MRISAKGRDLLANLEQELIELIDARQTHDSTNRSDREQDGIDVYLKECEDRYDYAVLALRKYIGTLEKQVKTIPKEISKPIAKSTKRISNKTVPISRNTRCALCGYIKGAHQAKTAACPYGMKDRIGGRSFLNNQYFEAKPEKKVKISK